MTRMPTPFSSLAGAAGRSVEAQFVDRTGETVAEAAFTGFPAHTVARTLTVQYLNVAGGLGT